jgi:penicillin-binding protein 2
MKSKNDNLQVEEIFHTENKRSTDYLELPLSGRTFLLVGLAGSILILGVFIRIGYLNIIRGSFYGERASGNVHREIVIPAPRGVIVDRYQSVLVENKSALSVWVDVPKLIKERGVLTSTLKTVAEATETDLVELVGKIYSADLEKKPIVKILSDITASQAISLKSQNLSGLQVNDDYTRQYKDNQVFAHIVGYGDQAGLEGYYNDYLSGRDGKRVVYRDALGKDIEEKQINSPISGKKLVTTIDAEFQRYFYNRLSDGLRALGRTSGVGIALDPESGEVLSLISLPSFDNNNLAFYLDRPNQPFFNRAVAGQYNPGSTIKPLHALSALREKIIEPEDRIFSSGQLEVPNPYDPERPSIFLDWAVHGWVDLYSALARSSNVYFYHIGGGYTSPEVTTEGLGIDSLNKYWKLFRLGEKTGIDIPTESAGFLPNAKEKESRTGQIWRIGDTYNVSIGQGDLLLTPIQLISFIASIGNGGKFYQPRLALGKSKPKIVFDYSDWSEEIKAVQIGLQDAVQKPYGTARLLDTLPVSASGKTGSAQVSNNTRTNAFFVGYAPSLNPKIAILVLVEDALEGSLNAVPIARDVFEWYYYNRMVSRE